MVTRFAKSKSRSPGMHRKRQNKYGAYGFHCDSQWKYGKNTCVQVSVREVVVKSEILSLLAAQPKIKDCKATLSELKTMPHDFDTELREINQRLAMNGRILQSLYENLVDELITAEEFVQMKADYEAKNEALTYRAEEIHRTYHKNKIYQSECLDISEAIAAAIRNYELTAEIMELLVDRIAVRPDKSVDISLRLNDVFGEVLRCG